MGVKKLLERRKRHKSRRAKIDKYLYGDTRCVPFLNTFSLFQSATISKQWYLVINEEEDIPLEDNSLSEVTRAIAWYLERKCT